MTLKNVRNFIFTVGIVVLLIAVNNIFSSNRLNNAVAVVIDLASLQEVVNAIDQIEDALEEERISVGQYPLNGDMGGRRVFPLRHFLDFIHNINCDFFLTF